MYINRIIEKSIVEVSKQFSCIAIYGARQIGKSTTVKYLFGEKFNYINLDDFDELILANDSPKKFFEINQFPIVIDEIQKSPNLLNEIKRIIDTNEYNNLIHNKKNKINFILTGSNKFELQNKVAESLAGRCGIIDMSSFCQAEIYESSHGMFNPDINNLLSIEKCSKKPYLSRLQIYKEIFEGSMPAVRTKKIKRDIFYKSYINTYLERDVTRIVNASSLLQFKNFLELVAFRTSQQLKYDHLARDCGIDVRTCKRWISILESSGIIYILRPFLSNNVKRITKSPKIYFLDTGLCSYLCKWETPEMLEKCAMSGAFFETFVISEIVKNMYSHLKNPNDYLYYYRDSNQKEIDLIYSINNELYPIEIKRGIAPAKANKNFNVLNKLNLKVHTGLIIDTCDKIRPLNDNAYYFPVYLL